MKIALVAVKASLLMKVCDQVTTRQQCSVSLGCEVMPFLYMGKGCLHYYV